MGPNFSTVTKQRIDDTHIEISYDNGAGNDAVTPYAFTNSRLQADMMKHSFGCLKGVLGMINKGHFDFQNRHQKSLSYSSKSLSHKTLTKTQRFGKHVGNWTCSRTQTQYNNDPKY